MALLRDSGCVSDPEYVGGFVSGWLADHLEALAETGNVDHGSFCLAAHVVRVAGGVE